MTDNEMPTDNNDSETDENHQLESIQSGLALFRMNKITKSNVWQLEFITNYKSLIDSHNDFVRNFRNIGPSLDTTVKIYSLRVDTVHKDIIRASSRALSDDSLNDTSIDQERNIIEIPAKRIRNSNAVRNKNKKRSIRNPNIATDPKQLNAKLKLIPKIPDALSYKVHSNAADDESPENLFLIHLANADSTLKLSMDEPFFDERPPEPVTFDDEYSYECAEDDFIGLPIKVDAKESLTIRQRLSGYRLQETPAEFENEELAPIIDADDSYHFSFHDFGLNGQSSPQMMNSTINEHMEVDIAPINFSFPIESLSTNEYTHFSNEEHHQNAPSYWRTVHKQPNENINTKRIRRKRPLKVIDSNATARANVFIKLNTSNGKKLMKTEMYEVWSRKKMPEQQFLENKWFKSNDVVHIEPIIVNHQHNEYAPDPSHHDIEEHHGTLPDMTVFELSVELPTTLPMEPAEVSYISQTFIDAPKPVDDIPIHFDRRPKILNMKKYHQIAIRSIDGQIAKTNGIWGIVQPDYKDEDYEPGIATFSNTFKSLTKHTSGNISPSVALLTMMHAANQNRLRFERQVDYKNDFKVFQLK